MMLGTSIFAQDYEEQKITTGVPFLTITPDGRGGSMGDIGAAVSTTDITSIFCHTSLSKCILDIGLNNTVNIIRQFVSM